MVVGCELLKWRGLCYCQLTVVVAMSRQVHGQGTTNRMDQITTAGNSAWRNQSELLEPLGSPRCASPAFMPRSCTASMSNIKQLLYRNTPEQVIAMNRSRCDELTHHGARLTHHGARLSDQGVWYDRYSLTWRSSGEAEALMAPPFLPAST